LKLHDTYRKDRHADRIAESRAEGLPECPDGLGSAAQWLWDFVVDELGRIGVAKRIDTPHLWAMCEAWGLYRNAVEIAKGDPTDKDARIAVVSYMATFEAAAAKCGLSPSDRAKLTIAPEIAADPFADFLNKKA